MNGQSSNHAGTPTPGGPTAPILPPMDPAQLFQALATMQQLTNAVNMTGIQFPWLAGMPQPPAFPPLPQFNIQSLQDQSLNQPMSPENDDKILIAQLVEYRKRDGSYKEALDALHGVRMAAANFPPCSSLIRKTTIQQACGKTITWITNIDWTHGLNGGYLTNSRLPARVRVLNEKKSPSPR